VAKNTEGFELLRLAREQGLITEAELDQLMSEHMNSHVPKSPTRLAIEKGMLSDEASHELETQMWVSKLPQEYGGYRVEQKIGHGGMAVVFKAQDLSLGKIVAVKVLLPDFSASETYLARFHREAHIAAKLTHPNTVQVFSAGAQEGLQYLVMEYVEGDTLSQVIKARGRIPEQEALGIIEQLCGALDEAAALDIVHRDIKPGNVLMSKWGLPKLADFGIAKEFSDIRDPKLQMSLTVGVVGTPTYMSPEQARGVRRIDFRADIFSLGATLYHMVIGDVPFFADTPQETMVRVVSEAPRPPRSVRQDISEAAGAIICKMMAKEPDNRYQSYDELRADLEAARNNQRVSISYRDAVKLLQPPRREDLSYDEGAVQDQASVMRIVFIAGMVVLLGLFLIVLMKGC